MKEKKKKHSRARAQRSDKRWKDFKWKRQRPKGKTIIGKDQERNIEYKKQDKEGTGNGKGYDSKMHRMGSNE